MGLPNASPPIGSHGGQDSRIDRRCCLMIEINDLAHFHLCSTVYRLFSNLNIRYRVRATVRHGEFIRQPEDTWHAGPLFQDGYKPQFSGHDETFPLRYGWLKKVFDRVAETENEPDNRNLCWDDGAIARFGVGKNMVASMRHWAKASGIIEEPTGTNIVRPTKLGRLLFRPNGLDPYMEHPRHALADPLAIGGVSPKKTTWFWAFSPLSRP